MSKVYEFEVKKTVTYVQYIEVVDAHSEDEARDTVMDLVDPEDDAWEIDNEDWDIEPI